MQCNSIKFVSYKCAILVEISSHSHFITAVNTVYCIAVHGHFITTFYFVFSNRDEKLQLGFLSVICEELY